ncbi:alpha/beta hydrolase fold domain-containing protein [Clostridium sp. MCC353]|uniref:alpha/beta hydrolase n=1 Tax=Clostridium sp. MCC353 TaxID=2592646 RepID=UPI001C0182CD|nr:alpha/beta hydrolase [Clostridium sp. MCC353]MBT9775618.1 alpha/beta hydrolase fold domain-containing protein [Clostridium sp. MCC353]
MEQISREEMIQMAKETRKRVTSAVVTQEELDEYPVEIQVIKVPVRSGESTVYFSQACGQNDGAALVINLHGGGFIRERTASDDLYCRKLVHALGCKTLDVDYRVAPEYPFPTALYECYDVVQWAFAHGKELGIDTGRIILTGHSAGGNMAAGICMIARKENTHKPLLAVLDYPPMDLFTDPEEKEVRGGGVPAERARLYNLYYCEKEEQSNYLASPVFAEEEQLKDFPKTLVITAGLDDLCNEAETFALKLAQAGNEVTLKRFPGASHGFTVYRLAEHEKAMELILRFIKENLK